MSYGLHFIYFGFQISPVPEIIEVFYPLFINLQYSRYY